MDTRLCPCASGRPYAACCGPLLAGRQPASTAEALMRSRYTAYVERNIRYLLRTWHPSTRPHVIDPAAIPPWCGLEILRTRRGRETDAVGTVEFVATALIEGQPRVLRESSRFVKEEGQWLYVDGDTVAAGNRATINPDKVGRNERCPCGSGKKFKKCCGC